MLRTGKLDLSPVNRVRRLTDGDTTRLHKTMIIGPVEGESPTANAFLIDQMPHCSVRTHFHVNSQFQVFVGGDGSIGNKEIQPYVAQYVGPSTGYGPIVAGDYGLWYMTLRPSAPAGAIYLPEGRDRLDRSKKMRQMMSAPCPQGTVSAERPVVEMIAPQDDGLAAWMVYVAPGATVPAPVHEGGLARYYVVGHGELIAADGAQLAPLSVAYATGADMNMPLHAGPAGLEVMVLQFPADAI